MEDSGALRGFEWEEAEDITVLSEAERAAYEAVAAVSQNPRELN